MKTIILLTNKPIRYDEFHSVLLEGLKKLGCVSDVSPNGEQGGYLRFGKVTLRSVSIDFTPNDRMSGSSSGFEAREMSLVPFDAYLTNVDFHDEREAATVVKILLPYYPEMLIYDDENDSIATASIFLTKTEKTNEEQ